MESRQSDRVREKEGMRRSAACPDGNPYRSVESKVAGANSAAVYMPPRHRGPAWAEGEVADLQATGREDTPGVGVKTLPARLLEPPAPLKECATEAGDCSAGGQA